MTDLARKVVEHFSMAGLALFGGETKELKEGLGREEAREGGRASDFLRSIATRAFLAFLLWRLRKLRIGGIFLCIFSGGRSWRRFSGGGTYDLDT